MASATITVATTRPERNPVGIYLKEAKYELLKLLRMPAYALPTLLFPAMFYILFGLVFGTKNSDGGIHMPLYLVATYGTFGVIGAALFGFGTGVATERGQGWMLVKRASPMPPMAYIFAKTVACTTFGLGIAVVLMLLGTFAGGIHFTPLQAVALMLVLGAGSVPFCAFGLAIGYFAGPNSAAPIVNLIYLPIAFCSGLWIPIDFLPGAMKTLAHWLPPYHLAQLALRAIGAGGRGYLLEHVADLALSMAVAIVLARIGYQRDKGKLYG